MTNPPNNACERSVFVKTGIVSFCSYPCSRLEFAVLDCVTRRGIHGFVSNTCNLCCLTCLSKFIFVWIYTGLRTAFGKVSNMTNIQPGHIPVCLWEEVKWCFCQSQYNLFYTTFKKGLSILKVLHSYQIRNVAELPLLVDWKKISGQLFWSINSFRHFSSKMSNIKVNEECLGFRLWCHFGLRKIVMSIFSNLLPFFRLNDRENNRQTIRENNHHRCVPKLVVQLKVVHMRLHLLIDTGLLNPVERLSSSLPVTYVVPSWNSSDQIM